MKEYDCRFYVVHDRYDYPGGMPRSLEVNPSYLDLAFFLITICQDLKDRYCSVCRKLLRNRPWAGDEASKVKLMQSFEFDKGLVS
jgi:DNA methyltransferase 1-associated protein 1